MLCSTYSGRFMEKNCFGRPTLSPLISLLISLTKSGTSTFKLVESLGSCPDMVLSI